MRTLTALAMAVALFIPAVLPIATAGPCSGGGGFSNGLLDVEVRCEIPQGTEDGAENESGAARPTPTCRPADPLCREAFQVNVPSPDEPVGTAPITIADLASFAPAVGELVVQPDGWGVRGVPINFHATVTDHVQDGTLLGQPIRVRWRPVGFTFAYGDGSGLTTTEPGTLWAGPDDDWTTTSTSHEYDDRGAYTASLTVELAADVAGPNGWVAVAGTLDVAVPTESVRIVEVRTVLTRGDCIEYPDDPGCAP